MVVGRLAKCGGTVTVLSLPRDGRSLTPLMYVSAPASRGETSLSEEAHFLGKRCQSLYQALLGTDQGWNIEFEKDWQASNGPACVQIQTLLAGPSTVRAQCPRWVSWPRVWPQWTLV